MALADLTNEWNSTAPAPKREFINVPAGTFDVRITNIKYEVSTGGHDMLVVEAVVADGEFKGGRIKWNIMLMAGPGLQYARADLATMGWEWPLTDIENHDKLATLLDKYLRIARVPKGTFTSKGKEYPNYQTYINKAVEPSLVAKYNAAPVAAPKPDAPRVARPKADFPGVVGATRQVVHASKAPYDEPPF